MNAFDVVVLGGGTAGVHVATETAAGGKSVALVEAGLIGGESPYLACLPSNSMLMAAARGDSWEDAVARRDEATGGLDDSAAASQLSQAGVTIFRGTGRVLRPGTVEVADTELSYSDLVVATGCEPVAPPIEGLADIPAWTTAQSLCSPDLPRRLIVLGGGPAGCELTQIYASFGSQVTLVEAEPGLLPGEPAFAGEILVTALRRAGAEIYLGARATKAERTPDGLTLALEDGTRIDADRLLLASGRRPRLSELGLDTLGLQVPAGLAVPTTTNGRVDGAEGQVWAAGDITGITHTHAGRYQAQVVAANILGDAREADYSAIPRCVFTTPSVYAVGVVPEQAATGEEDGPQPVTPTARTAPGLAVGRASLSDTTPGHLAPDDLGPDELGRVELYADPDTGLLAGAVAVGPDAASWMGEITLAIRARIPMPVLADVVHAFPTYGEALHTALQKLAQQLAQQPAGSTAHADQKEFGRLSELDMETPEGDAIEQQQEVVAGEDVAGTRQERPFDVDEADAAEQERAVDFDDDDYR